MFVRVLCRNVRYASKKAQTHDGVGIVCVCICIRIQVHIRIRIQVHIHIPIDVHMGQHFASWLLSNELT